MTITKRPRLLVPLMAPPTRAVAAAAANVAWRVIGHVEAVLEFSVLPRRIQCSNDHTAKRTPKAIVIVTASTFQPFRGSANTIRKINRPRLTAEANEVIRESQSPMFKLCSGDLLAARYSRALGAGRLSSNCGSI